MLAEDIKLGINFLTPTFVCDPWEASVQNLQQAQQRWEKSEFSTTTSIIRARGCRKASRQARIDTAVPMQTKPEAQSNSYLELCNLHCNLICGTSERRTHKASRVMGWRLRAW